MKKKQIFQMYGIGTKVEIPKGIIGTIEAVWRDGVSVDTENPSNRAYYPYDDCTLILRPLSSLTDEEKVKWYDVWNDGVVQVDKKTKIEAVDKWIKDDTRLQFTPDEFAYLLSLSINLFPNEINTPNSI